jgi:hypothetical protein
MSETRALDHPLRVALLDLVRQRRTLTSTEAARALGESSGACSFHLRQLARYGYLEPATTGGGRAKPWRVRQGTPAAGGTTPADLGPLARELEDEGYRFWLAHRDTAAEQWRRDDAFSEVLYLTPDELTALAGKLRAVVDAYRHRTTDPAHRPAGSAPVAAVARVFPLLSTRP